jgi:hypothetical protein
MPEQHLHIVSFDIPWPPNYGGVIDVFYKIRALHAAGVKIRLHCFEYHRDPAPELLEFCEEVHYYPRKTGIISAISLLPYITFSRRSEELLRNLQKDDHPILFEGLHSCYYLSHRSLRNRVKIYRESNIEHQYYYHLSKAEKNLFRKVFFRFSGLKLKAYEKVLAFSTLMLAVSREDAHYLSGRFPGHRVEYLPSFHHDEEVCIRPGKGDYALYHGNLTIAENIRAAEYLAARVFGDSSHRLVIAGLDPPDRLIRFLEQYPRVKLVANPTDELMFRLIRGAQVNVLVTFQPTGLKLKLLNALFNGRFCLVNPEMITGTELGELCEVGKSAEELRDLLKQCMERSFDEATIARRREILSKWHSNRENCKKLIDFVSLLTS